MFPFIQNMLNEVQLRALSRPGQSSSSSANVEKPMSMDLPLCLEALKQQRAKHRLMPNTWKHPNVKNNKILYHVDLRFLSIELAMKDSYMLKRLYMYILVAM